MSVTKPIWLNLFCFNQFALGESHYDWEGHTDYYSWPAGTTGARVLNSKFDYDDGLSLGHTPNLVQATAAAVPWASVAAAAVTSARHYVHSIIGDLSLVRAW